VRIFCRDNHLVVRADYSPDFINTIKSIPDANFNQWEWLLPKTTWTTLKTRFNLTNAHCYPFLKEFIDPTEIQGIKVRLTNNRLQILAPNTKLLQKAILTLETLCSYEEVTDEYNKETRKKVYTRNNITLLERFREEPYRVLWHYPTGLRHRISMFLELFCNVIVDDATVNELPKPYLSFPGHPKYPARDYQSSIADKASAIKYATIVKPTGSGKTRTAAEIIRLMRVNTLFLTNSRLLLSQTSIAFRETLNTEIGIIGGGTFNIKPVTVATSQSIWALLTKQEGDGEKLTRDEKRQVMRSLKDKIKDLKINNILLEETDERTQLIQYLASVDLQFVDEAHGLGAEYSYLVGSLTNPCMSMGLTATSQREDEKDILMEAATGAIWRPVKEEQLIKDGYLLPVKVIVVPFQHKQKGIAKGRNISKLNAQMITGNAERNQLIANLCTHYSQKYKTLVLTKEIEHGQGLAGLIGTTFISSKDKKLQAEAILGLINGTLKSLVSSPILEQGVDIKEAELLIDAVPRKSTAKIIQAIGRVRRTGPGKTCAYVITLYDMDDGVYLKQSLRKIHILESAGFEIHYATPEQVERMTREVFCERNDVTCQC